MLNVAEDPLFGENALRAVPALVDLFVKTPDENYPVFSTRPPTKDSALPIPAIVAEQRPVRCLIADALAAIGPRAAEAAPVLRS